MKIKYEFADGDVEVDVPNEWASISGGTGQTGEE